MFTVAETPRPSSDRSEVDRLRRDQEVILRNWREETEMLVIAWQEDKRAWIAEREAAAAKVYFYSNSGSGCIVSTI